MDDLKEFKKLLRHKMNRDLDSYIIKEVIDQAVCEMEVLQLMGDRWLFWLN